MSILIKPEDATSWWRPLALHIIEARDASKQVLLLLSITSYPSRASCWRQGCETCKVSYSRFEKRCGVLRGKLQGPNASSMPHEGRCGLLVWQVRLRPHLRTEQEGWRRVGESCSADLGRMTNPAWILMVARSLVATVLDYCALRAVIFDSRRQPRKTEGNNCVVGYSAPSWLCLYEIADPTNRQGG
jgi:hypothetical protein